MFWFGKAALDVHALIAETSPTPLASGTEAVDTSSRVPWVADYAYGELPRNMPFLYVWFVVNSGETSKGSIPGEQLWVGM